MGAGPSRCTHRHSSFTLIWEHVGFSLGQLNKCVPLKSLRPLLSCGMTRAADHSHLPGSDCMKEKTPGGPGEALSSPGRSKPPARTKGRGLS